MTVGNLISNNTFVSHSFPPLTRTDFLCIGNAIVDVFAETDTNFMDQNGITEPVQHIKPEHAQKILAELAGRPRPCTLRSGGGAANTAKIAAIQGSSAAFSGCTGNDELAAYFKNELIEAGAIPLLKTGKSPTGVCLILNNGRETRIAASPSAAFELDETCISEKTIENAGIVVVDGYILDRQYLVRRIFQIADKFGIPVSMDTASVPVTRNNAHSIIYFCKNYRSILFMNADESIAFYQAITGSREKAAVLTETEKEKFIIDKACPVLKKITGEKLPVMVIKLGEKGALAISQGKIYRKETQAIDTRNTTGAGDAFCAAFLKEWLLEKSIVECLDRGNTTAAEHIMTNM